MEINTPFSLFANCVLVKGFNRSTICDLQRNTFHLIPNSLHDILASSQGKTIAQVKADFDMKYDDTINEYFGFLIENDLILFDEDPGLFPSMDMQWHCPTPIVSAILDFNSDRKYSTADIAQSLDTLGCTYVEIRCFSPLDMADYHVLVRPLKGTTVCSISLITAYSQHIQSREWVIFCDSHSLITSLTIHSSPTEELLHTKKTGIEIKYLKQQITDQRCCGKIGIDYFTAYIETYTESLHHNSCLNRKISIDTEGNIKNCPSMRESFGNIADTTLIEALEKPGFKQYWNITKDQISVCKDCEFRHICTDCRAYLEDPENMYSKPLKCGYDPYTCTWEEWSTHPMKQKAIAYYDIPA